jgi:hypothetical protein
VNRESGPRAMGFHDVFRPSLIPFVFSSEIVLPKLLRPAATHGLSPAGARKWLERRFRGLIVSVMLYPLACAYPLLRPIMRVDRNSCGWGATGRVLVVPCLAAKGPTGLGPVRANFNYRTIPIAVKSKMTILRLPRSGSRCCIATARKSRTFDRSYSGDIVHLRRRRSRKLATASGHLWLSHPLII